MKPAHLLLVAALSAVVSFATAHFASDQAPTQSAAVTDQTAFDHILSTNTLRCGYAVATPWFMVDPNTKNLSGVGYDVTNALASKIGIKVDWVEETGWGVAEQGLVTGRYDMLCGSVCIDPRRARAATYSTPFLHIPVLATVRADDKRFDGDLSLLNNKDVRIGVKSGHVFEFAANEQFPMAQKVYANDISDDTEFFQMLKSGKIDVAFAGQSTIDLYNSTNDEKIRSLNKPVRYCNGGFMLPLGDNRLKYMIDNAIGELNASGQIEEILARFVKPDPRYVLSPALLFRDKQP